MRSAITRAVEEIQSQYHLEVGIISAGEKERRVFIKLPAIKKYIYIQPYTSKAKIKSLIREALKEEKAFQEIMSKASINAKQKSIF